MPRLLGLVVLAVVLTACAKAPEAVRLATGCDGPEGSCARYVQGTDPDGAPIDRATLIVPFTAAVRVAEKPSLMAVTAVLNLETRGLDLKLVPVTAVRVDPQNGRQILIDVAGLLAHGAAIDLPDGMLTDAQGRALSAATVKVKTPLTPFEVALAGVAWDPSDKSLFSVEGMQKPKGVRDEAGVRQELEARLRLRPRMTEDALNKALAQYDSDAAKKRVPDHRVRAGLMMLTDTSAEYAIQFILAETNRRGVPFEPVEVQPLLQYGALAAVFYNPLAGKLRMAIDADVAADTLENIGIELAHEAVHSSLGGGSASEETLAKAVQVRLWQEFLVGDPSLALQKTPSTLTRNAETLAFRNSGRFGYPRAGLLPRPGIEDALRGTENTTARSFKDLLFKPDVYGDLPKGGDTGTEVLEAYYQKVSGAQGIQGRFKFDQNTLRLFDKVIDQGFTDEQMLTIVDALRLKPVPAATPRQ